MLKSIKFELIRNILYNEVRKIGNLFSKQITFVIGGFIMKNKYPFTLPELPYAYDALEPFIDEQTNMLHHDKHFAGYVNNLNAALEKFPEFQSWSLEQLLTALDKLPAEIATAVRNNGGGAYNHTLYFDLMTPTSPKKPLEKLAKAIDDSFGSFDAFFAEFKKAALGQFGSGWAWLAKDSNNKLVVKSTPNQDTVLALGLTPILAIDVWEHAYYLNYQNKRADYVERWFEVVNWELAEQLFLA